MGNWYLLNGLVYRNHFFQQENVLILNGRVVAFGAEADDQRANFGGKIRHFNAQDSLITRGFIDLHTHLREPGFATKETIQTGTEAAAAGGFTTVCPMPNTNPTLDTLERLEHFQKLISQSAQVKIHPIAALTLDRKGKETVDYRGFRKKSVLFFSDDGDPLEENIAKEVFLRVQEVDGVLINHLEDKTLVQEGFFYEQIPAESEYGMLQRDLEFVKKTGCRYHAAHLSCYQAVELIAQAKTEGLSVTAEVTPHHLTLTHNDIKEPQGNFQMKPPLRTERDRQALLEGLKSGVIDLIATDHAPHGTEKELGLFDNSPFGVTGLETAFPILYTNLVLGGQLNLERLLECLTVAPARLLGVESELRLGVEADLVVLDLVKSQKVKKANFKSKGTNSPYLEEILRGWPVLTLVNGEERFSCEY